MGETTLFYIIIFILTAQYLVHQLLEYLNAQRFTSQVPEELKDVFDEEEYQKSQQYKKTNYRFGLLSDGFSLSLTLAFLIFGGFEWIDTIVRSITDQTIPMALLFFGIILWGSSILGLPFSYYQTFVIEEKFGFNKTTKSLFLSDMVKGWLLSLVFGGGILALFIWFYQWTGPNFWLYAWAMALPCPIRLAPAT